MTFGTMRNSSRLGVRLAVLAFSIAHLQGEPIAGAADHGTICVVPNPATPPTRVSPGGFYNPATLELRLDKRQPVPWPHKEETRIERLDLAERHLVVLRSDGKPIQSFWFRFSDFSSDSLCLSFDGYQGVQLRKPASSQCKCK